MILVIIGVSIVLFILGMFMIDGSRINSMAESVGFGMGIISAVVGIISVIVCVLLIFANADNSTIDERLAMYEEENRMIEQQIDILVNDYQEYEKGVFSDATTDSAITLVSLYPELKADQLVSSQIDIYVKNNEQIKQLKLEQINAGVISWWLYFGGK